uniref:PDZ domain-containing protein n=1 Tax=Entomoneis paludosa TaxID=265537 RepID=A0A7S2YFH6_9STRA|mmetsp:Transcript_30904/g.64495  ORF Transcript_30904/g.64495 Transcript_30904/m.64495 type:complete len:367 (+) Transcript_30904:227-1327(+)
MKLSFPSAPLSGDEYDTIIHSVPSEGLLISLGRSANGNVFFQGYRPMARGGAGPAEICKLVRNYGDVLLFIDGVSTESKSYHEVLSMIHGCDSQSFTCLRFRENTSLPPIPQEQTYSQPQLLLLETEIGDLEAEIATKKIVLEEKKKVLKVETRAFVKHELRALETRKMKLLKQMESVATPAKPKRVMGSGSPGDVADCPAALTVLEERADEDATFSVGESSTSSMNRLDSSKTLPRSNKNKSTDQLHVPFKESPVPRSEEKKIRASVACTKTTASQNETDNEERDNGSLRESKSKRSRLKSQDVASSNEWRSSRSRVGTAAIVARNRRSTKANTDTSILPKKRTLRKQAEPSKKRASMFSFGRDD